MSMSAEFSAVLSSSDPEPVAGELLSRVHGLYVLVVMTVDRIVSTKAPIRAATMEVGGAESTTFQCPTYHLTLTRRQVVERCPGPLTSTAETSPPGFAAVVVCDFSLSVKELNLGMASCVCLTPSL